MTEIIPSDAQYCAINKIKQWFSLLKYDDGGKLIEDQKQCFYLAGYAGVGKSTVVKYAIGDLGLNLISDVETATLTGKAAYVLKRMGTPARTIASLAYGVWQATDEEIELAEKTLFELEPEARNARPGQERLDIMTRVEVLRQKIRNMKQPQFGLNPDSDIMRCKLLVLDECSMVNEEMAADLMSFRKPILVLGDPGQLPPIRGEGAFTTGAPDHFLTEIHRQATDSPIIRLATMARNGEFIPYGRHGDDDDVWKMTKREFDARDLVEAGGQVICGLNATRLDINNKMRAAAGFDPFNPLPDEGSKIICLRNQNSIGLINGMFIDLSEICGYDYENLHFIASVKDEDGKFVGGEMAGRPLRQHKVYTGHFEDHVQFDKHRADKDWKHKRGLVECTFGWAITCHKAQGSAFDPTIVWDDHMSRNEVDRRRWLYTAITRAESRLLILD